MCYWQSLTNALVGLDTRKLHLYPHIIIAKTSCTSVLLICRYATIFYNNVSNCYICNTLSTFSITSITSA